VRKFSIAFWVLIAAINAGLAISWAAMEWPMKSDQLTGIGICVLWIMLSLLNIRVESRA